MKTKNLFNEENIHPDEDGIGEILHLYFTKNKENNTIQIKRPNEGERINYDLIDKGFTTSNN